MPKEPLGNRLVILERLSPPAGNARPRPKTGHDLRTYASDKLFDLSASRLDWWNPDHGRRPSSHIPSPDGSGSPSERTSALGQTTEESVAPSSHTLMNFKLSSSRRWVALNRSGNSCTRLSRAPDQNAYVYAYAAKCPIADVFPFPRTVERIQFASERACSRIDPV